MRLKFFTFAAIAAMMATFVPAGKQAEAGFRGWMMCWVPAVSVGASTCVNLPRNWYIRGVSKPYCTEPWYRCDRANTSFRVNRSNLRDVSRYANISSLEYGTRVTIYSRVYR